MQRFSALLVASSLVVAPTGITKGEDQVQQNLDHRVSRRFQKLDMNNDKHLTLKEFQNIIRRADQASRVKRMFERLDKDGNGRLSLVEFRKLAPSEARFSELMAKRAERNVGNTTSHDLPDRPNVVAAGAVGHDPQVSVSEFEQRAANNLSRLAEFGLGLGISALDESIENERRARERRQRILNRGYYEPGDAVMPSSRLGPWSFGVVLERKSDNRYPVRITEIDKLSQGIGISQARVGSVVEMFYNELEPR